jgi:hypothetical protein
MKKTAANEGLADNNAGRNADCVSGFHGAQSGRKRAEMQAPLADAASDQPAAHRRAT